MSSIKFCDRHQGPFPAGQEGSSKVVATINRKYDTGETYEEHATWDFCPNCTRLMETPKAGFDQAYTNSLELGLGMTPTEPVSDLPKESPSQPAG